MDLERIKFWRKDKYDPEYNKPLEEPITLLFIVHTPKGKGQAREQRNFIEYQLGALFKHFKRGGKSETWLIDDDKLAWRVQCKSYKEQEDVLKRAAMFEAQLAGMAEHPVIKAMCRWDRKKLAELKKWINQTHVEVRPQI
jgi:hypothetical protein